MGKLFVSVLVAAVLLTSGLQAATSARIADRTTTQGQESDSQAESARYFWEQMQRNGN